MAEEFKTGESVRIIGLEKKFPRFNNQIGHVKEYVRTMHACKDGERVDEDKKREKQKRNRD